MKLFSHKWGPLEGTQKNLPSKLTQAPPQRIVFLHGGAGTGKIWRPIAASLEKKFSILCPDMRGHGRSQIKPLLDAKAPTYEAKDFGKDLIDTLEAENFSPAWVVGHSLGVRAACAAAELCPELIKGLILVDLPLGQVTQAGPVAMLDHYLRSLPDSFESRKEAKSYLTNEIPNPEVVQYLLAVSVSTPKGGLSFPFDKDAVAEALAGTRKEPVMAWVKNFAKEGKPVLCLRGEKSNFWTRKSFLSDKKELQEFPSVLLEEVEGAGHGLPFEKREFFTDRIETLVEGFIEI